MAEYSAKPRNMLDIFIVYSLTSWTKIINNHGHESMVLDSFTKPSGGCIIGNLCWLWLKIQEPLTLVYKVSSMEGININDFPRIIKMSCML
jgi:hypothetical protein